MKVSQASLIGNAELQGTVPAWTWIGDEAATTFSYRARPLAPPAGPAPDTAVLSLQPRKTGPAPAPGHGAGG